MSHNDLLVPHDGSTIGKTPNGDPVKVDLEYQNYFQENARKLNERVLGDAVILEEYTVATVPTASDYPNGVIIVSNEVDGRTIATSDGTNWRRVKDGAIIS